MITWIRARYAFTGAIVERDSLPALAIFGLFTLIITAGVSSGLIGYHSTELNPIFIGLTIIWCAGLASPPAIPL